MGQEREHTAVDPRLAATRARILEAATAVFLDKGYLGTSMDEVAAQASASKMSVYKHFGDKASLFAAVVESAIEASDQRFFSAVAALADGDGTREDLRRVGRELMRLLMQPRILQLRRLVIGEASRFPELGRWAAERGPERSMSALVEAFDALIARGRLMADDVRLAAGHFSWLILSIPVNRAMFTGDDAPFPQPDLDRFVDEGVRVFAAAYLAADDNTGEPRRSGTNA